MQVRFRLSRKSCHNDVDVKNWARNAIRCSRDATVLMQNTCTNFPIDAIGPAAAIEDLEPPEDAKDHDDDKKCPDPIHKCGDCDGKDQMCTIGNDSGCKCNRKNRALNLADHFKVLAKRKRVTMIAPISRKNTSSVEIVVAKGMTANVKGYHSRIFKLGPQLTSIGPGRWEPMERLRVSRRP